MPSPTDIAEATPTSGTADAGASARPLLSVRGLTTSFRRDRRWTDVVRNVSFDVRERETLAIVGESGSGKSVTALSVMGLLDPDNARSAGTAAFLGRDLLKLGNAELRRVRGNEIAMIFQEPMTSLNPVMTIGRQISETLSVHRGLDRTAARAEAVALLDRVCIPSARARIDDYPHQFSGGMRQRVMIAIALACRPKLLIADEPTTALDVTVQGQILELIRELQAETGMSVLFITHDMGVVAEISDRTLVMFRGEVVEEGGTVGLFRAPQHPYSRALLSVVPRLGELAGTSEPRRFPTVDLATGAVEEPPPAVRTVETDARPVVVVRNLITRFPVRTGLLGRATSQVHAVENVSFEVQPGETLSLVGESGCGKSTTGRSILQLVRPTSGSIVVDGQDVMALRGSALRSMRRRMQMIFQDPFASLNPRMRVGELITEPMIEHASHTPVQAQIRAMELMEQVGLQPDMADRFPHEFSGGQRQRVSIARALSLDPKLLVADESVSALDASVKAQIINLLIDLQARLKLGYIFISHDMAVVERISHRVAVMYLGEIVEIGPRDVVLGNPQHSYTIKLLSAVPVPDPERRRSRPLASADEIKSPVHPRGFVPPSRTYVEVGPGHFVLR